jgi:hypothetical protein
MEELKFNGEDILVIKVPFNVPKETLMDRCRSIINEFPAHKVLCIPNDYEISVMKIEDVEQIRDKITEYIEMAKVSNNE